MVASGAAVPIANDPGGLALEAPPAERPDRPHKRKLPGAGAVQPAPPPPAAPASAAGRSALGCEAVGRWLLVHWPQEWGWFEGLVTAHDAATGQHSVAYIDGDREERVLYADEVAFVDDAWAEGGDRRRRRRRAEVAGAALETRLGGDVACAPCKPSHAP